jgi:hypothetical protein
MRVICAGIGLLALIGAVGCTNAQAKTPADEVPLATPAPPARVIVPPTIDPVTPPADPSGRTPPRETPPATPRKPETPPTTPPVTPVQPPPQNDPAVGTLQTTANVTEVEKKVRALIAAATRDLARVDYRALSTDAKAQYDQAKRFIAQAEGALKIKNVVFANQLADKAAALAALLVRHQPMAHPISL